MPAPATVHIPHLALACTVFLLGPWLAGGGATRASANGGGAAELRLAAEKALGAPVALDPRLPVPACPAPFQFAASAGGRSIAISCPVTGWRMVAPLAAMPSEATAGDGFRAGASGTRPAVLVRRGDLVTVTHHVPGFVVTVEAVAEASGGAGDRILLRNRLTGARFPATIGTDGVRAALR
ncbi:flagella basal body P-ring formation protein FlgA [Thermaurantiacus sp.]